MNEKEIGEAMRKKRGDKGLRETAREAKLQPHQIISIEQAKSAYTTRTLIQLADTIGAKVVIQ